MSKAVEFFLYTKPNCSLCDILIGALDKKGVAVQVINIEVDSELMHRYGARIPVLVADDKEICEGSLDSESLDRFLANNSQKSVKNTRLTR
ncbi:MAG: glutaredoxin family protein [Gammaproteobacteria bacterium]|jgi:glutaredoxin